MRVERAITVVGCHAGGEIGNVVVGGVLPPPGGTVFEQMQALARDDSLRRLLLREPRGSVAVHANLIVPSQREDCAAGYIIMEPTEYPAMSGSNTICVATVLLETGMVEMHEPETTLRLEAPAGVVEVTARCANGKCESVELTNVPCFVDRLDAQLEVDGLGTLTVDVAFGGMWYAIADAHALGFALEPSESARALARRRADQGGCARAAAVRASGEPRDCRRQHRRDRGAVARRRRRVEERRRRRARAARPLRDRNGPLGADGRAACPRRDARRRRDDARVGARHDVRRPHRLGDDGGRPGRDRAGDSRQRLDHRHHAGARRPRPTPSPRATCCRTPGRGPTRRRPRRVSSPSSSPSWPRAAL